MILLQEQLTPNQAKLVESTADGKNTFLSGIMMQSNIKNQNGRVYPFEEISKAVAAVQQKIAEGNYVCGELNHPDNLSIDLKNVSHIITELKMDGDNAVGKCKILNTPMGNIAKGLLDGGVRLGVSSRGTGNVTNEGAVSDFNFVTIDIVANPSAPNAYPSMVRESIENTKQGKKVLTLAEAVVHDPAAQKYFKNELRTFIEALMSMKK